MNSIYSQMLCKWGKSVNFRARPSNYFDTFRGRHWRLLSRAQCYISISQYLPPPKK